MKTCTRCKETKKYEDFSKQSDKKDGYTSHCKQCLNERNRKYYEKNRKKVNEKNKENYQKNIERERERHRIYYETNKEEIRKKHRKYQKENLDAACERTRRWIKRNPEKHKEAVKRWKAKNNLWKQNKKLYKNAHYILNYALQTAKVKKPETCEHCQKQAKLDAHHEDYMKPLEVTWLCRPCHKHLHKIRNREQRGSL